MKTFATWLKENHGGEDSPLGDLSEDIQYDPFFPKRATECEKIYDYLRYRQACRECINAFWQAFKEYSEYRWEEEE